MNNNKIFEKVKMKIAISNNKEEDIVMKKRHNKTIKCIGIATCIIISTTILTNTGITLTRKYLDKFGSNSSQGVQTAVNNDYVQDVDVEYQNSSGIDITVDSFLLDDSNFDIVFDIKLSDEYDAKEMRSLQLVDLKVIDEIGREVFATTQAEAEYENIQELHDNIDDSRENYKLYFGGYGENSEIVGEHEIRHYMTATGNPVNFPKSKKLTISFSRIRVLKDIMNLENPEKNPIYKGQWNFELDVPEKMYNRDLIYYKMKNVTGGEYIVDKAQLSNTAFKIYIDDAKGLKMDVNEYVETSDGKKFTPACRSDGDGGMSIDKDGNVKYYNTFNLTQYDATDTLKVHLFKDNGDEVTIELVKEKCTLET